MIKTELPPESGDMPSAEMPNKPKRNLLGLRVNTRPKETQKKYASNVLMATFQKLCRNKYIKMVFGGLSEITAIILGVCFIWVWLLNIALVNEETDISFIEPNLSMWFAHVFEGTSGDIGSIKLNWNSAKNEMGINLADISISGKDNVQIQYLDKLSATFDLNQLLTLSPRPSYINIRGGEITFLRRKDQGLVLGLGTPETVGRFGILYSSSTPRKVQSKELEKSSGEADTRNGPLGSLRALSVSDAQIHVQDDISGFLTQLVPASLDLRRSGSELAITMTAVPALKSQNGGSGEITFVAQYDLFTRKGNGEITGADLRPAGFAPPKGTLDWVSGLKMPLDIRGDFSFEKAQIKEASLTLDIAAGEISLPAYKDKVQSGYISMAYKDGVKAVNVKQFKIVSDKLSMKGAGTVELKEDIKAKSPKSYNYKWTLDEVDADLTPFLARRQAFDHVELIGSWKAGALQTSLSDFKLERSNYALNGALTVAVEKDKSLSRLAGHINNTGRLPATDFLALWPPNLAPRTRNWLLLSIQSGQITELSGHYNLTKDSFLKPSLSPDDLSATIKLDQATVKFMSDMPLIMGANGSGQIRGSEIIISSVTGRLNNLQLTNGRVQIPNFRDPASKLHVDTVATGQISHMLELADRKPIELSGRFGQEFKQDGGQGSVKLKLERPLTEKANATNILYELDGQFTDLAMTLPFSNLKLTDGQAVIALNNDGITVSGPAKINGRDVELTSAKSFRIADQPTHHSVKGRFGREILDGFGIGLREFIGGEMDITAELFGPGQRIHDAEIIANLDDMELTFGDYYHKPKGEKGLFRMELHVNPDGGFNVNGVDLTATDMSLKGDFSLKENLGFEHLYLNTLKVNGLIDGQLDVKLSPQKDRLVVDFKGREYNATRNLQDKLANKKSGGTFPVSLTAQVDSLILTDSYSLSGVTLDYQVGEKAVEQVNLSGQTAKGPFIFRIKNPGQEKPRPVLLNIPNFSDLAQSLFKQTSFRDGDFILEGNMPAIGKKGPLVGNLEMNDFNLTRAPALAQILSLASLKGLTDTFAGSGLYFNVLDVPFSYEDSILEFREARMNGPAIGMTGNGSIDFGGKLFDVDGVLVPSYTANSLLGDIPIIGDVIVGKKGEGIFALNYTIKGPYDKTQVTINPLSALTPGFLRRIFDAPRDNLKKAQ